MRNRQVRTVIGMLALGLLLGLSLGCESNGRITPAPEPQPRPDLPEIIPPGIPMEPGYDYTMDGFGNLWRYNKNTGVWEKYDPDTGNWVVKPPPPWASGIDPGGTQDNVDYGIVPDPNGNVSPFVWVTTFQGQSLTELTADDKLDFHMAVNPIWTVATDNDPDLLAAIGPGNISYHALDPPQSNGAVLKLNDISIRNLALFIHGTGFAGIDSETPFGNWALRYDPQANVVTVSWQNNVVDQIPLD